MIISARPQAGRRIHGRANVRARRRDGRVRRRANRLTNDLMTSWEGFLTTVDHLRVELDEVASRVSSFMFEYGTGSMDSVHAATYEYVDADGFVTNDQGFADIPPSRLSIYTDNSGVVACRNRRPRN